MPPQPRRHLVEIGSESANLLDVEVAELYPYLDADKSGGGGPVHFIHKSETDNLFY